MVKIIFSLFKETIILLRDISIPACVLVALFFIGQCAKKDADNKVLQECISIFKDISQCEKLYDKIKII